MTVLFRSSWPSWLSFPIIIALDHIAVSFDLETCVTSSSRGRVALPVYLSFSRNEGLDDVDAGATIEALAHRLESRTVIADIQAGRAAFP
jgi:hypothetical protein